MQIVRSLEDSIVKLKDQKTNEIKILQLSPNHNTTKKMKDQILKLKEIILSKETELISLREQNSSENLHQHSELLELL